MKKVFGNLLITSGLGLLIFIYLPFISLFINPAKVLGLDSGFVVTIPKISAQSQVVEGVNPWDEGSYLPALQHGVADANFSTAPGQKGLIFLFAHSSAPPWEVTRENIPFLRLGELNNGDTIDLEKNGQHFNYTVFDKRVVNPGDVRYVLDKGNDELILQTCTPIGTDFQRLLVFARPIS